MCSLSEPSHITCVLPPCFLLSDQSTSSVPSHACPDIRSIIVRIKGFVTNRSGVGDKIRLLLKWRSFSNINAWIGRLKPGFEPPPAAQAVERSLLTIPPAVLKQLPPQSLPIAELLRYTLLLPQFTDSIRNDEREAIVKAAAALSTVKRKGGKGVGNVLDVDEDDGVAE
ncbi:hypothetical protein GGX14DRAFT_578712 [Mycena pura]|uniref:Uncharacterized protein n=1 Tax=Mycena pura TaxID=153505 RepID=A0AAD6US50_9AGAR|nr:hypothetical protein GGX14DRAFT_578712 [Mycena pura]